MKNPRLLFAIAVLALASLACQTLLAGRDEVSTAPPDVPSAPEVQEEATPSDSPEGVNPAVSSEFPLTDDAYDLIEMGDGSIIYYTRLSLEDVMKFYRDEYASRGYTERELLTVVANGTFSMVFDGDPSGKAVVIQSVDIGDGSRTVAIRLEDT